MRCFKVGTIEFDWSTIEESMNHSVFVVTYK